MIKNKENNAIKEIKLIRDGLNGTRRNQIKDNNINISNNQVRNKVIIQQQKKRNNETKNYNNININKMKKSDEEKYYDFQAHFKYNELVDALNKLKTNKKESNSNTKTNNTNTNNIININRTYINNKDNYQKIILFNNNNNINNDTINNNNRNRVGGKKGGRPHKVVSRNVQVNNYIKYIGYIDDGNGKEKNKGLTSISNNINIKHNKTSYLPKNEVIKQKINLRLEELNKVKDKILVNSNEKKIENNVKVIKDDKLKTNNNYKYNNLISISLSNNNNNKNKNVLNERRCARNQNNNQINKKIINNNIINKISKEESFNNSKMQLKLNNFYSNNFNLKNYNNENKYMKNKKIKKNIFDFNCILGEKRKAHSSSLSKNKNYINKISTHNYNNIHKINNTNNVNNYHANDTNKKQNTLNNFIHSTTRINPVGIKSYQTNKNNNNTGNEPKIKIISFNYADLGKMKNN